MCFTLYYIPSYAIGDTLLGFTILSKLHLSLADLCAKFSILLLMSKSLKAIIFFLKFSLLIIPSLVCVAFITLLERKILGVVGARLGPNKVSVGGVFQPIADAVKLAGKECNYLSNFSWVYYYVSSFFMILMSFLLFFLLFMDPLPISFKFSVVVLFLVLGFNSLNSIICGWSSFTKYSLIGSIRTVTQLVSYEAVIYLVLFFFFFCFCSFDLSCFGLVRIEYFGFLFPCCLYIWIPSFLAELNRTPYDFSEGESELVSGFNTEFGSLSFTLIFLAEYGSIFFFCVFTGFLFFSSLFFSFILFFFVIWIRSVLPRFRFDKLMGLCWKFLIPFLTILLIFFICSFI